MWTDLVLKAAINFGYAGIIFIIWFYTRDDSQKERRHSAKEHQKDRDHSTKEHQEDRDELAREHRLERKASEEALDRALTQSSENMAEQRRMYESNVLLVKGYERLSGDLQDVIIMNTQAMTKVGQAIETNQFCPLARKQQ